MESQSRNTCTFPSSENEPLRSFQGNSKEDWEGNVYDAEWNWVHDQ